MIIIIDLVIQYFSAWKIPTVDILPSSYYDILIVNTFVEFEDLMYFVGRIEDGIKKGRIVNTEVSMREEKRIVPDEHVQAMSKERKSKKKSHMAWDEPVVDFPHSSSYARVPLVGFPSSQKFVQKCDRDSDSSYPQGNKEKRAKVYHSLPMSYGELLPVLIQIYGISVIPARPRRPLYPKGYDINARCEYHRGVKGHSTEDCMTFKNKVQSLIDANPTRFRELVNAHQKH